MVRSLTRASLLLFGTGLIITAMAADTAPVRSVTITRTIPGIDSVKVDFAPVQGAADYRIYEAGHPEKVKYAGLVHLSDPTHPDRVTTRPATEIEWNGLTSGKPASLIVEAVDAVGPAPPVNQLAEDTKHMVSALPLAAEGMRDDGAMIGSNSGPTPDGKISINGQGSPHNKPRVLAQSRPITVHPINRYPLPSGPDASQIVFDTFSTAEIAPVGTPDAEKGERHFTLHSPQADWELQFQGSDLAHSQPFVMDRHFMDLLFDGATAGASHRGRSACALSPVRIADFSSGRILHLTMEVDGHLDGHRWVAFNLAPADDPLKDLYWSHRSAPVNRKNQAFFCEISDARILLGVIDETSRQANSQQGPSTIITQGDVRSGIIADRGPQNGKGLDNRSRFDLFLAHDRYAFYEEGKRVSSGEIKGGLPFDQAKVYYSHFFYHSADELFALKSHAAYEKYWIEQFPYSDERHWDNMGFEVLPANIKWENLKARLLPNS